jgi:hypothetical protein
MRAVLGLFVATTLGAAPAFAQEDGAAGLYLGAGQGDFSTGIDEIGDGDDANLDFGSAANADKLFAGWRFNRLVAVQIDYLEFERFTDAADAPHGFSTQAEGLGPSVVGTLPLGPLELFARAGMFWYDVEIDRNDTLLAAFSGRDPIFGAGIGFTFVERLNLRAEYEVVEIDGLDDPNAVWLTAAWRF